jgi:hypothetical protein
MDGSLRRIAGHVSLFLWLSPAAAVLIQYLLAMCCPQLVVASTLSVLISFLERKGSSVLL